MHGKRRSLTAQGKEEAKEGRLQELSEGQRSEEGLVPQEAVEHQHMSIASNEHVDISNLCVEHRPALLRFAFSITKDLDLADDVVQTTMLKLCKQNLDTIKDHMIKWLFVVCRNTAFKAISKQKRYVQLDDDELTRKESDVLSPDTSMIRSEKVQEIRHAVSNLSLRHQQLLELRYHHDMSYEEIASKMNTTPGNVGFMLNSCKAKLQKLMSCSGNCV